MESVVNIYITYLSVTLITTKGSASENLLERPAQTSCTDGSSCSGDQNKFVTFY